MTLARSQSSRPYKFLLIGDSDVGKTSLMFRFADDTFTETFTPTIGIDFKIKTIFVRNRQVKLQLWDTAGQERFFNITRSYYRNADAIVLVYDRTVASSFQNISRWMRSIDENAQDNVLRVLVGNKSDRHHSIVISTEEGKKLAEKYNIDYFQTSAKSDTDQNVSKMFYSLTEKVLDCNQEQTPKPVDSIDILNSSSDSTYEKFVSCCSTATANTMHK